MPDAPLVTRVRVCPRVKECGYSHTVRQRAVVATAADTAVGECEWCGAALAEYIVEDSP